jgi:UDP-N-acetylmuramyl pentapeptide phosphotransferase/UDP-N-acetylglucosamine-1-phosphate transferase
MLEIVKGSPLAAFAAAFIVTWATTPLVRALALRFDAVAKPDARRKHAGISRSGAGWRFL